MGSPFRRAKWNISRPLRPLRYRILVITFILFLLLQQHLCLVYRGSLYAKYAPTTFRTNYKQLACPSGEEAVRIQEGLLANRHAWKVLGAGWEGTAFAYNGSVIKRFSSRSPFRNCVPGRATLKWPTEIPASLHFGGSSHSTASGLVNESKFEGFLPVKACFMTASPEEYTLEWHLVTPLMPEGNLVRLSKKMRSDIVQSNFREVDALYRPAFHWLLHSLDTMHTAGFCHDDIKPSNIFVQDKGRWILGDLGNVRHISHPYHSSRIWTDNKQLQDCRANDAVRALKSYLQFVRAAAANADTFDAEFVERRGPLSRLFVWAIAESAGMKATTLRTRSLAEAPLQVRTPIPKLGILNPAHQHIPLPFSLSRKRIVANEVGMALRTRVSEKTARWKAMTWLFGVPESRC